MAKFNFKILHQNGNARVGQIETPHGIVNTPCFTSVGTQASVKTLSSQDLWELGTELLFGNTYHLHLRPGEEVVKKMGGLSKFMSWNGPTFTDSGGFQVFSLANKKRGNRIGSSALRSHFEFNEFSNASTPAKLGVRSPKATLAKTSSYQNTSRAIDYSEDYNPSQQPLVKITEEGVKFRSYLVGSLHYFTPEESIIIQQDLGADLIIAFDDCPPYPSDHSHVQKAVERTHRWAVRSQGQHKKGKTGQALYGVIQGGVYEDLRKESAKFISDLNTEGIAIGGVAVGEGKKEMIDVLNWVTPILPREKPRHLLGVGEVDDIFEIIERGVDTFDCVIPTRMGRTGFAFISPEEGNIKNRFRIDITKAKWQTSKLGLDANCNCKVCKNYTRGYISHLFRAQELLAYHLLSYHNTYFINNLTKQIRQAILDDNFKDLKGNWL